MDSVTETSRKGSSTTLKGTLSLATGCATGATGTGGATLVEPKGREGKSYKLI